MRKSSAYLLLAEWLRSALLFPSLPDSLPFFIKKKHM